MAENKHQKYVELVNEVLDAVKAAKNLKTDTELAAEIGEHKVDISKYRKGTRVISDWKLLRLVKIADMDRLDAFKKIILYKSLKKEVEEVIQDFIDLLSQDKK
ncbi:hypothetical protein D6779_06255 [Candidatus Parcubacteria bacterium]|nr:MAG: hypothetical protein D6779_06255 [Candidatus Parcubacteria bacterium]